MTKTEQRKAFELLVPTLDDEVISAFLTLTKANYAHQPKKVQFTSVQLEQIDQSFDDFTNGRSMSLGEAIEQIRSELNLTS